MLPAPTEGGKNQMVTRRNLSQAVGEELLTAIREGRLRPGERLPPERELMERFSVGRNTIREAVQSLAAMGVLDVRPGRGTMVLSTPKESALDAVTLAALLDGQTVLDLYEFRRLLEVETAGLATQRGTDEDIAAIRAALEHYGQALAEGRPGYPADIDFHRAVADASHNAIFIRVLAAIGDLIVGARRAVEPALDARHAALADHERIYEAIAARDTDGARTAMRNHMTNAIEFIRELGGLPQDGHRSPRT
jgi:DNA-binding FadR family transcriptional regulator